MSSRESARTELTNFLSRVHRWWTLHLAGRIVAAGLGVLLGVFWLLVPLEHFAGAPVAVRVGLWVVLGLGCGYGAFLLWRTLSDRSQTRAQALALERYAPELREQLITAVDTDGAEAQKLGYADWLLDHTLRQAHQSALGLNLRGFYKGAGLVRSVSYFGLALVGTVVLGLLFPQPAARTLEALAHPTREFARPVPFSWEVDTTQLRILQYESIQLKASVSGSHRPEVALLQWRYGEDGEPFSQELSALEGRFEHTLSSVPRSIQFWFTSDAQTSDVYTVQVSTRPELVSLSGLCLPPRYTGAANFALASSARRWVVPEGSQIELSARSDRPLASGYVLFADSSRAALEVSGATASSRFDASGKRTLRVFVADSAGFSNFDPVPVQLEIIPDLAPQIALLEPRGDRDIPENMTVPLAVALLDDYGVVRLELRYQVDGDHGTSEAQVRDVALPASFGREGTYKFNWSLADQRLFPGDRVLYAVRVYDNRQPQAQWAETPTFVLRLPTLDEIIAETERNQSERTDEVAEAVEQQRGLSEQLREMAKEMTGQDKVEWENRQQLEEAHAMQEKLAEEMGEWAEELEKEAESLSENRMASLEMVQKMNEIARLLEEVMTPELREAMERLQKAMESMTAEEMRQALEEFQMNQEEMLAQLDRTLAQLRQMQIQQMMENMLRQAEELAANQEAQNRAVEGSPQQRTLDSLARHEDALHDELADLQKKAAKLSELNRQSRPNKEVQEFAELVESSDAGNDMSEMSTQMQSGEKGQASAAGQKASSKLRQMLSGMQKEMEELGNQMTAEQLAALRDLTRRTLSLSEEQELLGDSARAVSHASLALREMAAQQSAMGQSIDRLLEDFNTQAQQNLFLSADVRRFLQESGRKAEAATGTLADRNGPAASMLQYETMFSLNEAGKSLMESMNNQSQCQGGSQGQGKMHMGMQNMSQEQLKLNESSQAMQNPFGLSPSEQESVKRLAGHQQSIQGAMRDLAQQHMEGRDRLGRLEEMAHSMDEVIEGLEKGEMTDETLERQRQIYNRMLDFQKSLQRQDYENRRQSQSGSELVGSRPGRPEADLEPGLHPLDWSRFQNEWYPPGFRALVKEYFDAVSRGASPRE